MATKFSVILGKKYSQSTTTVEHVLQVKDVF